MLHHLKPEVVQHQQATRTLVLALGLALARPWRGPGPGAALALALALGPDRRRPDQHLQLGLEEPSQHISRPPLQPHTP